MEPPEEESAVCDCSVGDDSEAGARAGSYDCSRYTAGELVAELASVYFVA